MAVRSRTAWAWMVAVAACGSTPEATRPVTAPPLTADERLLFEDGIDFVSDPEALEGRWRDDWSRELDQRIRAADLIGRVKVHTLRHDTDLDRRVTIRLALEEEQTYIGTYPDDLTLLSREGDSGFGTIEGNDRRVLNESFVLFLKWEVPEGATEVVPRWHLSPAAEPVVRRTEYLLDRRRGHQVDPSERRVHVHDEE